MRNTFVIFLLSGFWHGANWAFIAWGAYHALLFLPLILLGKNRKYRDVVAKDHMLPTLKEVGQMLLTFFMVVIGWIIFRAESIGQAWEILCRICTASLFSMPGLSGVTGFSIAIVLMVLVEWIQRRKPHVMDLSGLHCSALRYAVYAAIVFLTFALGGHTENFIYFQF